MPEILITERIHSTSRTRHHSPSGSEDGSQGLGARLSGNSVAGSGYSGSDRSDSRDGSARGYPHLTFPDETEEAQSIHPGDSATSSIPRSSRHSRHLTEAPQRSASYHRESHSRHRVSHAPDPPDYRDRHYTNSPPSVDSVIDVPYHHGPPVHRSAYTSGWQYAPSTSEPYSYPPVPTTQMLQSTGGQPPYGYDPYQRSHGAYYPPPGGLPYASPFTPPPGMPYGAAGPSYFPQYPPGMAQYALPAPTYFPPFGHQDRQDRQDREPKASSPDGTSEETMKIMKEMFEKQQKQIEERDAAREAERKAIEDAKKAAEERAAADKKLQEAATAAAKEEAAKQLAEAEKKATKALEEAKEASEKALKEAKEAAEKETAEKVAAAKAGSGEKKEAIKFKDAIGRKYQFPWDMCSKWDSMEELIRQAFQHVEGMAQHVYDGHYDLAGPSGEIILKDCWEATIEPGWTIVMHMWPLPEERPDDLIAGLDDILVLDDKKHKKGKGKKGAKIISVPNKKKKAAPKGHEGRPPVPPPAPRAPPAHINDALFGEIPIIEVYPDSKPKKAGKKSGGLGSWMLGGAKAGSSKGKGKK